MTNLKYIDVIGIRITHCKFTTGAIESEVTRTFRHDQASELLKVWYLPKKECNNECVQQMFRIVGYENNLSEDSLNVEEVERLARAVASE